MGMYKYIRKAWKNPKENLGDLWQQRLIEWRKQPSTLRISRPTRLDRARSLGYKPKQGILIIRQRVQKSSRRREKPSGGRRPKTSRLKKIVGMNYQEIAERRAVKNYVNCEVLNSYLVANDGKSYWFEVILVDKMHPSIKKDKQLSWMQKHRNTRRVYRGLTSAGRKTRGLRKKGVGAEKIRPSQRANMRKAK